MKNGKVLCYVAGKLNDVAPNYIKHMHQMIKEARKIRKMGISVYVPCVDFLEGLVCGDFSYDDYFSNSQPFLLSCDIMYVCPGWETSTGTKREIETALKNNIPVFYDLVRLQHCCNNLIYQRTIECPI
jgi:hypothetical protein